MAETKEEIKTIIHEFAIAAVEGSQEKALTLVDRLLANSGPVAMQTLLDGMTSSEVLEVGRMLSDGWARANAGNAARINAQKAALAKILAVLINTGAASLMAELN